MSGKTKLLLSCFFYGLTRLLGYWKKLETEDGIYSIYPLGLAAKNLREKLNSLLRVFFFIDFQIKILWEVRLPLIFGKVVICDRYVYDIIAGLMEDDLNTETFYKFVLQTTPIPQLVFLTDTSKEVLSTRRRISMNILDKKRKAYLILAYSNDFFVLDSSDDFEKNQHKVRQVSLSQLSGKNHAMRGK
jgi:thymidylate kinase